MHHNHCVDCHKPITSSGVRRCRACFSASRVRLIRTCTLCGGSTSPGFDRCRSCYQAARRDDPNNTICPNCGGSKSRVGNICQQCSITKRKKIQVTCQCGTLLPLTNRSGRCWNCAIKARNIRVYGEHSSVCGVEGCEEPFFALGMCYAHYRSIKRAGKQRSIAEKVRKLPCGVCGYSKLPSNAHRLDGHVGYIFGNMVPLCLNCHREVHKGMIQPPDPYKIFD